MLFQTKPWSRYVMRVARAAASRLETGWRTLSIQHSVPGARPSMPSISTSRMSPMRAQRRRPFLPNSIGAMRVARPEQARAQDLAVPVLEVLTFDAPRLRHRRLLPRPEDRARARDAAIVAARPGACQRPASPC